MSASNTGLVPPIGRRSPSPGVTAPDGSEALLLVDSHQGAERSSLIEVSLGPGEVTRLVSHRTVEEIWYVLEGAGKVWRCPPDRALRFLCHTTPPWPGEDEAVAAEGSGLGEATV